MSFFNYSVVLIKKDDIIKIVGGLVMKKRNILLIVVFLVLFILTGCGSKKVITTSDFKAKTEELGYTALDITSQYTSYGYIKEATVAESQDGGFQVEFYVLDNESNAVGMFDTNMDTFKTYKGNSSTESSSSMGNYSNYTLTTDGYYMHLCRVDNTLLYVRVESVYEDTVKSLIKELGY